MVWFVDTSSRFLGTSCHKLRFLEVAFGSGWRGRMHRRNYEIRFGFFSSLNCELQGLMLDFFSAVNAFWVAP